jgi:hypothetical protein
MWRVTVRERIYVDDEFPAMFAYVLEDFARERKWKQVAFVGGSHNGGEKIKT